MNQSSRSVWRPARIVSGGQTGVDRAALDVALELGIDHGGYCPRGRRAEDGPIAPRYRLVETQSADYASRTLRNVAESDATLILYRRALLGGTALTASLARRQGRPWQMVDLAADERESPLLPLALAEDDPEAIRAWLESYSPRVLNIAGPRESQSPGIYAAALDWLRQLFAG